MALEKDRTFDPIGRATTTKITLRSVSSLTDIADQSERQR